MPAASRSLAAPWWKRAVFYQVYPRSFMDANGAGVGDLQGLAHCLPYVADLGVDAVWLGPVMRSPMRDFGYDISDYCDIDPVFGTLDDFDAVVTEAHRLGLRLIVDQVWSHSSDRHPWFIESAASRDNPRADWYVWADARPDGTPPSNWQASFGGAAWTWNPRRRQYYLHNFLSSQPDLNHHCPDVQDAMLDVARFLLDRGVDGFRLDVVNYYVHDAALTDNPVADHVRTPAATIRFQRQVHNKSQPETLAFVARLRALLDGYDGERMAVGEIFDDDMVGRQLEYTDGPDRLHTAYSFVLLQAGRATPALFLGALAPWAQAAGWPSWSLGNHDVPRFPSRMAPGGEPDPRLTRCLLAVLLSLRGTPFLYQGEELGLPQAEVPFERLRDPFAIAAWTGGREAAGRDGARTPMPWTDAEGGGFSTATQTWLPLDPAHRPLSVERQAADCGSTLSLVRRLLAARRAASALQTGDLHPLPPPDGVLAFERTLGEERFVCLFELAGRAVEVALPDDAEWVVVEGEGLTPDAAHPLSHPSDLIGGPLAGVRTVAEGPSGQAGGKRSVGLDPYGWAWLRAGAAAA